MLRQFWLHVALLILSSNLFAQTTTYAPQPKLAGWSKIWSLRLLIVSLSQPKNLIMRACTKLCMKQDPISTIVSKYIQNPYVQGR